MTSILNNGGVHCHGSPASRPVQCSSCLPLLLLIQPWKLPRAVQPVPDDRLATTSTTSTTTKPSRGPAHPPERLLIDPTLTYSPLSVSTPSPSAACHSSFLEHIEEAQLRLETSAHSSCLRHSALYKSSTHILLLFFSPPPQTFKPLCAFAILIPLNYLPSCLLQHCLYVSQSYQLRTTAVLQLFATAIYNVSATQGIPKPCPSTQDLCTPGPFAQDPCEADPFPVCLPFAVDRQGRSRCTRPVHLPSPSVGPSLYSPHRY